jgi:hypothetical protein
MPAFAMANGSCFADRPLPVLGTGSGDVDDDGDTTMAEPAEAKRTYLESPPVLLDRGFDTRASFVVHVSC